MVVFDCVALCWNFRRKEEEYYEVLQTEQSGIISSLEHGNSTKQVA